MRRARTRLHSDVYSRGRWFLRGTEMLRDEQAPTMRRADIRLNS